MPKMILPPERFQSLYMDLFDRYVVLREKFPQDKQWVRLKNVFKQMKYTYTQEKLHAVRCLHYLEKSQISFSEERRALVVRAIELMQKVILQKKITSK